MKKVELVLYEKDYKVLKEIFGFMDIKCYNGFIGELHNMTLDEINESITNIYNQLNHIK